MRTNKQGVCIGNLFSIYFLGDIFRFTAAQERAPPQNKSHMFSLTFVAVQSVQ